MPQVFLQSGRTFTPADSSALNIQQRLPLGTYRVGTSPAGFYLEKVEDFALPPKLYGNVDQQADRIMRTFADRPSGTGVLLAGQKGAGKTMLTKRISQRAAAEMDVITILINQPLYGEAFNSFIQGISQPAIVLFDEFEKVYDRDDQQQLLTIFDGTYSSKKLFLLTCNDRYRVDTYMINRPGRIYYSLDFTGLGVDFIREFCIDNLLNQEHSASVQTVASCFSEFSFDMLKALVEEMNRFGETANDAMKLLNMKPELDDGGEYEVTLIRNGKPVIAKQYSDDILESNPLSSDGWKLVIYPLDETHADYKKSNAVTEREMYSVELSRLVSIDPAAGKFTFNTTKAGTQLVFERKRERAMGFNYDKF
ncbi:AAA family ATPase [Duganella sp. FT27W]|uniref:AAA family ATPase n=1 Tax=Duganella sp. FT27W TaxID=2654636 RepID=UPI00186B6451|nr:AAA family ATPase [Duganella sp. FT27W]